MNLWCPTSEPIAIPAWHGDSHAFHLLDREPLQIVVDAPKQKRKYVRRTWKPWTLLTAKNEAQMWRSGNHWKYPKPTSPGA